MMNAIIGGSKSACKDKQAQKELEEKMDKRIKLALENPLGSMGG